MSPLKGDSGIMSEDTDYVIALEFGGQSVRTARVDSSGNLTGPYRFALAEENPPSFGEFICGAQSIIRKAKGKYDISAVGVACPNPYISGEIVLNLDHKPAYAFLNRKPLRKHIVDAAGCENLFDVYDAGAAVKGELWKGDLPNQGKHMFLTLGTGLGSAFVFNGEIIRGQLGTPESGEIWEIQYGGEKLEESAGTTKVMVRIYLELGGTDDEIKNGNIKRLADIARNSGPPEYCLAQKAFKEFGKSLGEALAYACSDFGPESFVLAGNISKAFNLFEKELTLSYLSQLSGHGDVPVFKESRLIDRNGLLGAAYIAFVGMGINPFPVKRQDIDC